MGRNSLSLGCHNRSWWALSPLSPVDGHCPASSKLIFPTFSEWTGIRPGQTAVGWYPFLADAVALSLIIYLLRLCSQEGCTPNRLLITLEAALTTLLVVWIHLREKREGVLCEENSFFICLVITEHHHVFSPLCRIDANSILSNVSSFSSPGRGSPWS